MDKPNHRIMKYPVGILVFLFSIWGQGLQADDRCAFDINFVEQEIPFYTFADYTPQVALRMEYAKFEVNNTDEWQSLANEHEAYEIDLVFTKYPQDIKAWRTNYWSLLNDRLRALFEIDPSLKSRNIRWNMFLQTQCETEEQAKDYFHGFVIKYRPKVLKVISEVKSPAQLRELIRGEAITRDSTVVKILERNPDWDNMLVIMDWTGSMYQYGAQLVLWHKLNMTYREDKVQHFVFFNDGNNKRNSQKKAGRTGGVYRARTDEIEEIVETMEFVMKKGNGGDAPENDLEAVLTGLQYLDNYDEIVLIADNKSSVRDIELLEKIDRPVHIILCDVKGAVHPDYIRIAKATGGSLHTLEKDLGSLSPPTP